MTLVTIPSAPWTPVRLRGLKGWWRADRETFLLTDPVGTPVSADADPVGQWNDVSGNGKFFRQATTANKPSLRLNVLNGRPVIRFDGTDDVMLTTSNVLLNATQGMAFVVLVPRRSTLGIVFEQGSGQSHFSYERSNSLDAQVFLKHVGVETWDSAGGPSALAIGVPSIVTLTFDGSNLRNRKNGLAGTADAQGATASTGSGTLSVGARSGPAIAAQIDIAEIIMTNIVDDTDRVHCQTYLSRRYNIQLAA